MQGGVNRGKDLLPRYRTQGGKKTKTWLSTPVKKVLVYVMCLVTVFVIVHTLQIKKSESEIKYELDHGFGSGTVSREVVDSQIEVSEAVIENSADSAPIAAKNAKNSNKNSKSGNDVKALKQGSKDSADDLKAQEIKDAAPYKTD